MRPIGRFVARFSRESVFIVRIERVTSNENDVDELGAGVVHGGEAEMDDAGAELGYQRIGSPSRASTSPASPRTQDVSRRSLHQSPRPKS